MTSELRISQIKNGSWIKLGPVNKRKLEQSVALAYMLHQSLNNSITKPKEETCIFRKLESFKKPFRYQVHTIPEEEITETFKMLSKTAFKVIKSELSFVGCVEKMYFNTDTSEDEVYIDPEEGRIDVNAMLLGFGLAERIETLDMCFISGNELNDSRETAFLRIPFLEVENIPIQINKDVINKIPSKEECWITGLEVDSFRVGPKGVEVSAIPIHSSYEGVLNFINTNEDRETLPNGLIFCPTFWPFR